MRCDWRSVALLLTALCYTSRSVLEIFQEVSKELEDGRPYLVTGTTHPTAADVTFAALAAIVVLPPANYGGALQLSLPALPALADFARQLQATRAGAHVLKMYAQHRLQPPCVSKL